MKVSELIEALKGFPMDSLVITEGYENGFDSVKEISLLSISPNPETDWWNGEYIQSENTPGTNAVFLHARRENS